MVNLGVQCRKVLVVNLGVQCRKVLVVNLGIQCRKVLVVNQGVRGKGGGTGLVVRVSDSGSGDTGSILGRVGVLFP